MALNILSFLKKPQVVDIKSAKNIVIVYNVVSAASLLAACLYYMVAGIAGRTVSLYDIRDNIPFDADAYIWIGVGDATAIRTYVEQESVENNYLRNWAVTFHKRSVFINADQNSEIKFSKSLVGLAMDHFWSNFFDNDACYAYDISQNNRVFNHYAVLSEKWMTNDMDKQEVAIYLTALLYCYAGSVGSQAMELQELESNLAMKEEEVDRAISVYTTLNKTMAQSCRERVIDGVQVLYVTKMGPEVFPLLRRIALANRLFYHASEGSYGKLVFKMTK